MAQEANPWPRPGDPNSGYDLAEPDPKAAQKQAFGYGAVAPENAPGFGEGMVHPPDTLAQTATYIGRGMTNIPKKKEIIEGFGYPGQKHSAGGITTVGRIYYGFWEFGHLMFVVDRWIAWRQLRHFLGIMVCFIPFWIQMQWNVQMWEDFRKTHAS